MDSLCGQDVVIAGDVGGTKTVLGLFCPTETPRPTLLCMESYASKDFPALEAIVERFLSNRNVRVSGGCFGVPGPVVNDRSRLVNLPWEVAETGLSEHFGWPYVKLVNDLSATAFGIPVLYESELCKLNEVDPQPSGTVGVLAPGTGLGMAFMVNIRGHYYPVPSEGGHVDFAPTTERQVDLWKFLRNRMPHVSIESVISGPGLVSLYYWLNESRRTPEPEWLKQALERGEPAKVISDTALQGRDPVCAEALDEFVFILGASSGNLALTAVTTGGIYLGGGISPKILDRLVNGRFMEAFMDKGRFRDRLTRVPVRVILNDKIALFGAARASLGYMEF